MHKRYTSNLPTEMEFHRFVNWATGYLALSIGSGETVRDAMITIIDHAIQNEDFGKGNDQTK